MEYGAGQVDDGLQGTVVVILQSLRNDAGQCGLVQWRLLAAQYAGTCLVQEFSKYPGGLLTAMILNDRLERLACQQAID